MAKKATIAPLSIEEQMNQLAAKIIGKRAELKSAQEALKEDELKLITLMSEKGETIRGGLRTETRTGSIKLDGAKGKELTTIKGKLIAELGANYTTTELDIEVMWKNKDTDVNLRNALAFHKIQLVQGEPSISLKAYKEA
jgi:hypothetical protein